MLTGVISFNKLANVVRVLEKQAYMNFKLYVMGLGSKLIYFCAYWFTATCPSFLAKILS
jgi:hypothetical protein